MFHLKAKQLHAVAFEDNVMSNFANPSVGKLVVSNSSDDFFFFDEPFSQLLEARPDSLSSVDLPLK